MDIGCQSGKWLYLSVNKGAEQPAGVWDHGSNLVAAQEESVLGGNPVRVGVKD